MSQNELKPLSEILDEIEVRASKATPGPWDYDTDDLATWINAVAYPQPLAKMGSCTHFPKEENAAFIASARTDVPALVKALRHAMKRWGYGVEADITSILNQGRKP